jgi:drug/metabolite transporter (DMT)-like permease
VSDSSAPVNWTDNATIGVVMVEVSSICFGLVPFFARSLTEAAILLALAAPLSFGLSINVLARKLASLTPLGRMSIFALGASTGLLPLIATYPRAAVLPATPDQWLLALALGVVSALLPQLIYTIFVPKIGGAKAASLGSIELPTMFAIGWIAFGEAIGWREAVAGTLVLTAILRTPTRRPPASVTATASLEPKA